MKRAIIFLVFLVLAACSQLVAQDRSTITVKKSEAQQRNRGCDGNAAGRSEGLV